MAYPEMWAEYPVVNCAYDEANLPFCGHSPGDLGSEEFRGGVKAAGGDPAAESKDRRNVAGVFPLERPSFLLGRL